MAIKLDFGFERTATEPIDSSQVLTKAEMKDMEDSKMPDTYFAVCKDDKKLYVYDKSATPSAETGKFSVVEGGSGTGGALKAIRGTTTTTEIIEAVNAGKDILVYWTAADESPRLVTRVDIDSPYVVYLSCIFTTTAGDTHAGLFRVHTDVETTWTYESKKLASFPSGGTTGQALVKKTDNDGDVEWSDVEGNVKATELTQAEYDALSDEEKNNGTIYFITDGQGGGGGGGETPNLDAVLTKGNTTSKDINISSKIGSEIASNRIHSQGYTVSKADDTATSGGGGSRTTSIGSGAMTLYGSYVKNGSIVDEKDFSFGYSVNRGEEKLTARVQMDDEMKQAWRDALNIADKNYTTTEKKVGTFLGKDLYEITLTGININAAPESGQVTWYNLTQNKGIQTSWDIVDYEVLSRIADNTSSATRSVLDGLLLRGGGNSNWTIGNRYQSAMHIRALTLRYVKEAI